MSGSPQDPQHTAPAPPREEPLSFPIERGTGSLRHLYGPALLVAALTVIVLLAAWSSWGVPAHVTDHVPPVQVGSGPESSAELASLLKYQLEEYRANLARLDAIITLQALLIATTVLPIIRRSDSLKLFGNEIPLSWGCPGLC